MQTDLFNPMILLIFNFVNCVESLIDKIEKKEHLQKLLGLISLLNKVELSASQWYEVSFPYLTSEHQNALELLQSSQYLINIAEKELVQDNVLSPADVALLARAKHLLLCLQLFLSSSSSYPFLFAPLGTGTLEKRSYEHHLAAKMANALYKRIKEFKEIDSTSPFLSFLLSSEKTTTNSADHSVKLFFGLHLLTGQDSLKHNWQDIPDIDPSNFKDHYHRLASLLLPLERLQKSLLVWQLDETHPLNLEKELEGSFFKPNRLLTRYLNLLTFNTTPSSSTSSQPKHRAQTSKKAISLPPKTTTKPERKTQLQTLHANMHSIREALSLPTSSSQVESLDAMRDCHHQMTCHLDALESLFPLLKRKESLSFYQLHTLLIHQASAIEQAVKLAALARPKGEVKAKELQGLLKSTHQPSQFFERFLPCQPAIEEARWQSTHTTACAVDDFLAVPARYAVGFHTWMNLLNEWWDLLESSPQEAKAKYQEIKTLIKTNAEALTTLLKDVSHSLPFPQQTSFTPSLLDGTVQGLAERECFKIPQQTQTPFADFDSLEDSIYQVELIQRVSSLSRYETTADLISRRKYLHRSLHILSVNSLKMRDLFEESRPAAWCSSYTSTLLLSGAVCLEQSIQALLFWLPVSSQQQPDLHYLLSHRPGAGGRPVPLWQTHSIQDNADRAIEGLREAGKIAFADRLHKIRDLLSWLEPLLKQLYRYPFSVAENRSADTLRLFHALASIRRAIHEKTLSESSRMILLDALSPHDPEADLLTAFDALIEAHIRAQVVIPAHEILQASSDLLSMLQELTNTPK